MAKAINWPKQFREAILAEDSQSVFCAIRLGELYYEGQYWVSGEEIDIRCNHLKIRRAVIVDDLKLCRIQELLVEDLTKFRAGIDTVPLVVQYLADTYNQPVNENTVVTVVYYKNLPMDVDLVEADGDDTGRHL